MTRGLKSSEYRVLFLAFWGNILLSVYGITHGVDLMGLAALIPAINSPLMFYAGSRAYVKGKQGVEDA